MLITLNLLLISLGNRFVLSWLYTVPRSNRVDNNSYRSNKWVVPCITNKHVHVLETQKSILTLLRARAQWVLDRWYFSNLRAIQYFPRIATVQYEKKNYKKVKKQRSLVANLSHHSFRCTVWPKKVRLSLILARWRSFSSNTTCRFSARCTCRSRCTSSVTLRS